jgi:hypothetical protein
MGQISAADAVGAGVVKIDGGLDELQAMVELFALRQAEPAGAEPEEAPIGRGSHRPPPPKRLGDSGNVP